MFSNNSFPQTYYGPVTASGDIVRRLRGSGMAQAEFAGNQRAVPRSFRGIAAGSASSDYSRGVTADAERARGYADAMRPLGDYQRMLSEANLDYQVGSAAEQAGIRDLLLMQRGFNQDADITLRNVRQDARLDMKKISQDRDIAERQRKAQQKAANMEKIGKVVNLATKFAIGPFAGA